MPRASHDTTSLCCPRVNRETVSLRLNTVMHAVVDELGEFAYGPWYRDRALAVADALAKTEFDSEILREVGEAIGDVDNYNRTTAYASAARRATAAMHWIANHAATTNYPQGAPVLSDVSGDTGLEKTKGAPLAYATIEAVVIDVAEDCSASAEIAYHREQAIGMYQRDAGVADAEGTVWLPIMAGQTGVTRTTLAAVPSARDWTLEFAQDAARIAAHPEHVADEELIEAAQGGIAVDLITRAVVAVIRGQGSPPVERCRAALFEDVLDACSELAEDATSDPAKVGDYERNCLDAAKRVLECGRELAAMLTAYAALSNAFEGVALAGNDSK